MIAVGRNREAGEGQLANRMWGVALCGGLSSLFLDTALTPLSVAVIGSAEHFRAVGSGL